MSMVVNPSVFGASAPTSIYIGTATVTAGSGVAAVWPAGTIVDDFAMVIASNNGSDPGPWTGATDNGGALDAGGNSIFTKFLSSGDITSPPSWATTTGVIVSFIFRNVGTLCTVMKLDHNIDNGTGSQTWTTVANKPTPCLALIGLVMEQDGSSGTMAIPAWSNIQYDPSAANHASVTNVGFYRLFYDFTPADYTNSGSVTVNPVSNTNSRISFAMFGTG